MTKAFQENGLGLFAVRVAVVECGRKVRQGWLRCAIGENLSFNSSRMESYFFKQWDPTLHDAFVVAGAVEFCDRIKPRSSQVWGRHISLRVPVHEPERWSGNPVSDTLRDALDTLTGDRWDLRFCPRWRQATRPNQRPFDLGRDICAVIPFSDGLDSRAVAGLEGLKLGDRLVRIRLGAKGMTSAGIDARREPFMAVPYNVHIGKKKYAESSMRSRGFKFALVSAIAAWLSGAKRIIVPESGQGALGPCLVPVGQAYPDCRNHPHFFRKMEKFLHALIGFNGQYEHPYVWNTKGETVARFIKETDNRSDWADTRSCWQQNRHVSVNRKVRQCGVCAACMLRRMSVHAAGETESSDTYVWEDLGAPTFESGASPDFDRAKITGAMRQHAIAGVLHVDHLAGLKDSRADAPRLNMGSFQISQSLGLSRGTVSRNMNRLLARHKHEWESFLEFIGPDSFVTKWVRQERS